MSSKLTVKNHSLCRCCHSQGLKSLFGPCCWSGRERTLYIDLLKEINIQLTTTIDEDVMDMLSTICAKCIQQLKDALNFKHQVEKCEKIFQRVFLGQLNEAVAESETVKIKIEVEAPEDHNTDIVQIDSLQDNTDCDDDVKNEITLESDDKSKIDDHSDDDFVLNFECDEEEYKTPSQSQESQVAKKEVRKYGLRPKKTKNVNLKPAEEGADEEQSLEDNAEIKEKKKAIIKDKPPVAKKEVRKYGTKTKNTQKVKLKPAKEEADEADEEQSVEDKAETKEKKKDIKTSPYPRVLLLENTHYKKLVTQTKIMYQCAFCDKKWDHDKWNNLRCHVKKKHLTLPIHKCSNCDKRFSEKGTLSRHKLLDHNIDERIQCNACDSRFHCEQRLKRHMKGFHMLGEKHKCDLCDYESFHAVYVRKHKVKHKKTKDHRCAYCKKAFLRKATLNFHERIHKGDRRKVCSVCGQAFVQKASLNYHMTKYHPSVNF